MENEKLKRRLEKLMALAQRGVGGEKETAQRMLDKMLAKHDISLMDICDDATSTHWFKFRAGGFDHRLLFQVIYAVCGKRQVWKHRRLRSIIGVDCSEFERAQIEMRIGLYRQSLESQLDLAFDAFIQVNQIFPEGDDREVSDPGEFDPEYIRRLMAMANGMEKVSVFEALPPARKG